MVMPCHGVVTLMAERRQDNLKLMNTAFIQIDLDGVWAVAADAVSGEVLWMGRAFRAF